MHGGTDAGLDQLWRWTTTALTALLIVGALVALLGADAGAAVVVAAIAAQAVTQVTLGLVKYRRTMHRPWPAVQPLSDEDDW